MIQDAQGWGTGTTQRDGMRREVGGVSGWGYFGHLIQRTDSLKKTLTLGRAEGGRRRG